MLTNYPAMKTLIKDHQQQIDQDLKRYRLVSKTKTYQPKVKDRLLLGVGRYLVAVGSKLQNRAKSSFATSKGEYQAC